MRIVSFSEGTHPSKGSVGIAAVPGICLSLVEQGNNVTLVVGNNPYKFYDSKLLSFKTLKENLQNKDLFSMVFAPGVTKWAYSIRLLLSYKLVDQADVVFLHSLYSFPVFIGYIYSKLFKKPYFLYTHGVLAPFQRKVSYRKKKIYDWLIAKRILNQASTIIYTSRGEMEETQPLKIKAPTAIIPHGIDKIYFTGKKNENGFRSKYLKNHEGPVLLFLGRLNAKKGLDILIESYSKVLKVIPDARLVIVGGWDPPSYKSIIQNRVSNLFLNGKIVFTGPLFGDEKYSALIAADVFVLPSIAENFCTSMFEAMQCGLPVIISENLNLSSEVKKAKAGIVVKRDSDSFTQAIIDFLTGNYDSSEFSKNGLRFAKTYSWEKTGLMLNKIIMNVVQLKKPC